MIASLVIGFLYLRIDDETPDPKVASKLHEHGITDFFDQRHLIPETGDSTTGWPAKNRIDILTVWRQNWADHPDFESIVERKAMDRCVVRVVVVNHGIRIGPLVLQEREVPHGKRFGTQPGVSSRSPKKYRQLIAKNKGGLRVLSDPKDFLSCSIIRVDDEMTGRLLSATYLGRIHSRLDASEDQTSALEDFRYASLTSCMSEHRN